MASSSPVVAATLQTACLGVASSILAQVITSYNDRNEISWAVDWIPVFQFLIYSIISTPPNFMWQQLLESSFPAYPQPTTQNPKSKQQNGTKSKSKSKSTETTTQIPLSKTNTLIKLLLDQTISAAANTLLFSTFTRSLRYAMAPAPVMTDPIKAMSYLTSSRTGSGSGSGSGAITTRPPIDFASVDFGLVWEESVGEFWPFFFAGMRLWPLVALINYSLIKSVSARNLLSGMAGLGWGVYVCLAAANSP